VELAKTRLANTESPERRVATWQVLTWVLDRYLRLLHPVMPHLTEEIWGRLPHRPDDPDLLIVAAWPDVTRPASADATQADAVADLLELVTQIRNARADAGIDPGTWLEADIAFDERSRAEAFEATTAALARLARIRPHIIDVPSRSGASDDALVVVSQGCVARLRVPQADAGRDRERLGRELADVERQLASAAAKLADPGFTSNAPAAVVDGVRQRERELQERAGRLRELGADRPIGSGPLPG
jgi:valyl-tRNA synthetase